MRFAYSVDSTPTETRILARGEIDMAVADQFAEVITAAVTDGAPCVIVDLTAVTYLDSSGIRALLIAHKVAADHHRSLQVENPAPIVHRVLEIGGVLDLLTETT